MSGRANQNTNKLLALAADVGKQQKFSALFILLPAETH